MLRDKDNMYVWTEDKNITHISTVLMVHFLYDTSIVLGLQSDKSAIQ